MGKDSVGIWLKGLCVGATMMVPGISGGSMAMILGVYDRLIKSVSSFRKNVKENLIFLILFSIGGGIGILLFARPLNALIQNYRNPMMCFFIGIVLGSIPMIYKETGLKSFKLTTLPYLAVGMGIVWELGQLPADLFETSSSEIMLFIMLLIAGVVSAVALVLPGISVSYMLLLLGLYDKTIGAISNLQFGLLLPLGLGLALGVVGTTKILEKLMQKFPQPTYLIILGFVLGSVPELFPGIPQGMEWIFCIAALVAGFGIIRIILQWGEK